MIIDGYIANSVYGGAKTFKTRKEANSYLNKNGGGFVQELRKADGKKEVTHTHWSEKKMFGKK